MFELFLGGMYLCLYVFVRIILRLVDVGWVWEFFWWVGLKFILMCVDELSIIFDDWM